MLNMATTANLSIYSIRGRGKQYINYGSVPRGEEEEWSRAGRVQARKNGVYANCDMTVTVTVTVTGWLKCYITLFLSLITVK